MNSKKKHNINFLKPAEPAFITRLKQQAGYVEGPSVDTKKEKLTKLEDEDCEDRDDERPTVVVMNEGDLTAEEACVYEDIKKKFDVAEKLEAEKADLSKRVIFSKRKKESSETNSGESQNPKEKKKRKSGPKKAVLSFDDNEDDD